MNWNTYRITIANVKPEELVRAAASVEVFGTAVHSIGSGSGWDVEHGSTFETASTDGAKVSEWVRATLEAYKESAAYVTRNGGAPILLWSDGSVSYPDGSGRVFPNGPALDYIL